MKIIYDKYQKGLWFVFIEEELVASISKQLNSRKYFVQFYKNKKIKNCTTYTLKTAKQMIEMFVKGEGCLKI